MRYFFLLFLLLPLPSLAQSGHAGKRLITGVLRDSAGSYVGGAILIGDSIHRARQAMYQQMHTLNRAETMGDDAQVAALQPAWDQWRTKSLALMRLLRDSAYQVHTDHRNGRFRFWARPTDSIYVSAPHHYPQRYRVADLPRRGRNVTLVLRAEKCVPYVPCTDSTGREYAFIGEKQALEHAPETYYCEEPGKYRWKFYDEYLATYHLLQQLEGQYPHDTMTFRALDHYGWPPFRHYRHALLFVKERCGRPFYQRTFYPVYRTTDGRWAAPYRPGDYQNPELLPPIKAHPISFAAPVTVDIKGADSAYVARTYPAPYYRLEHGQAVAVYGLYVEEIMENRRQLKEPTRRWNRQQEAKMRPPFITKPTEKP